MKHSTGGRIRDETKFMNREIDKERWVCTYPTWPKLIWSKLLEVKTEKEVGKPPTCLQNKKNHTRDY